jgi:hypothetical protein
LLFSVWDWQRTQRWITRNVEIDPAEGPKKLDQGRAELRPVRWPDRFIDDDARLGLYAAAPGGGADLKSAINFVRKITNFDRGQDRELLKSMALPPYLLN